MTMSAMKTRNTRRTAPGPRGSFVMGNLEAYIKDPIAMLMNLRSDHGDVVRNRLGPFLTHALAHPEHVEYVLQDNHRNYSRGRFYDNFKLIFGDGLLTTDGAYWRYHRRAVQPTFHKDHIDEGVTVIGKATLDMVDRWKQIPAGEAIDVIPEMMHLSLGALGQMMFKTDISQYAEEVGPHVRFALKAMMPQGNMNDFIPRWAPTPFNLKTAHARRNIDKIIDRVIEDHRQHGGDELDVITLLLNAKNPETDAPFSPQEVHDEVVTVFLAGHETTGSGLAWALFALAQHPAILRRLREELDARLGGQAPTKEDLENLPYLDQVVNETLRVYPPIWAYTRDLIEDDEIGGFHIPAKSSIFMAPYVTHRHPEFWSNPEAFDPENFASNAPQRHKYAFFPFGGGMRKCIGYQVALMMMRVMVATVAQHFDLALKPGHAITRGALVSLRPLNGLPLVVTRRQPVPGSRPEPTPPDPKDRTQNRPIEKADASGCPFHTEAATGLDRPVESHASAAPLCAPVALALPLNLAASARRTVADKNAADDTLRIAMAPQEVDLLPTMPSASLAGKRIMIVNGDSLRAERVALSLARACARAWYFNPNSDEDVEHAARAFVARNGPIDGILDLSVPPPFTLENVTSWEPSITRTVAALHACYDDWLAEEDTSRLFYVAVTYIDGQMGYSGAPTSAAYEQPLGGIWAGLGKTLPQELPNCNVRILDLAPDEADFIGDRLISELYRWGPFEIGYSNGRRYTLQGMWAPFATEQAPAITQDDVVLFSGGARGIGLLCARALADRYGATVIVTGREQAADGTEPWFLLDDEAFRAYARKQLIEATAERPLITIRDEIDQLKRRRNLKLTLDEFAKQGLRVLYRVCDVTDAEAVKALCADLGPSLRIVVHNAGIDHPVRLAQKSAEAFINIVRTKVVGFINLCEAVKSNPDLVQFYNVGSLTGRWGGMTGETDYAAANEALSKLGFWAARHALRCTVKTLVWPTWEEVGMITNFEVTKRYVSPMRVADGLRYWLTELCGPESGEAIFMGAVGAAVTPVQIQGFNPIYDLPRISELIYRHHHLGAPKRFRIFHQVVTDYRIDRRQAPFVRALHFTELLALPASMVLEHALGVGAWVTAEGFKPLRLANASNIRVDLDAYVAPSDDGAPIEFRSCATGAQCGADWVVEVVCFQRESSREMLRASLHYREDSASSSLSTLRLDNLPSEPQEEVGRSRLNGPLLRRLDWRHPPLAGSDGILFARAPAADADDLWVTPYPPPLVLPVNHLESLLFSLWLNRDAGSLDNLFWTIGDMSFGEAKASEAAIVADLGKNHFLIATREGRPVVDLKDVVLSSASAMKNNTAPDASSEVEQALSAA